MVVLLQAYTGASDAEAIDNMRFDQRWQLVLDMLGATRGKLVRTEKGRDALRERVQVEHRLAHLAAKQGPRARYMGERGNLFDLRRHAAILNLEVIEFHGRTAKVA